MASERATEASRRRTRRPGPPALVTRALLSQPDGRRSTGIPQALWQQIVYKGDMNSDAPPPALPANVRQWPRFLGLYREPSTGRSLIELAVTLGPLFAIWTLMWASLQIHPVLCLILSVPAGGFLMRLFLIQHDCSHGSFFQRRYLNDWLGRALGILTFTPYDYWQRTHAMHHAGVGNLAQRGIGDVMTITVREYLARSPLQRLRYRLYRHPLIFLGVGPAYLFLLQHRLPFGLMRSGWRPWVSTMATNAGILLVVGGVMALIGVVPVLLIQIPTVLCAATAGVWLFYVQHQFEDTYWENDGDWAHPEASLKGSSHYVLPGILRWFSANIGVHHVHHLNSRIPFYRLPEVLRNHPELDGVSRLSLVESFGCVRLALWDESRRRLVSFRDALRTPVAVSA
jgi:omega-6 fatty acid desaturase (delta-12 desaturase)